MKKFQHVNFLPWIGEKYQDGVDGLKIFILGEAFINNGTIETLSEHNQDRERTIKVIEDVKLGSVLNSKKKHNNVYRSYNNTLRMLYNTPKVKPLLKYWDNYAFVNFFQKYLGDKKRGIHTQALPIMIL